MRAARRRVGVVAAIAVVAGVVVVWFLHAPTDTTADDKPVHRASNTNPDEPVAAESEATPRHDELLRAERTSETTPRREHPAPPVTWIEGDVTLQEPKRVEPPTDPDVRQPLGDSLKYVPVDAARLNGSFVPDLVDGPEDEDETPADPALVPDDDPRRVRVVLGKFRFDSHGATLMLVRGLELDGRLAAAAGRVALRADGRTSFEARWIEEVLLHVVDSGTGDELRDVTILGRLKGPSLLPAFVPRSDIVAEHRDSPFHVTRANAVDRELLAGEAWVGAPDHAWRKAQFDFASCTPQTIELEESGSLFVTVTGIAAHRATIPFPRLPRFLLRDPSGHSPLVVEARRRSEALRAEAARPNRFWPTQPPPDAPIDFPLIEVPPPSEPTKFDGLPPGDYVASIEIGDGSGPRRVLCSADVKVQPGECERVTLTIPPDASVATVSVEGTLHVPPSWRFTSGLVLRLKPEDVVGATAGDSRSIVVLAMAEDAGTSDWRHWRIDGILPGTYRATVAAADFETQIVVGPEGTSDVALLLPEPAELVVHVVDDESPGDPVRLTWLAWRPASDRFTPFDPTHEMDFDAKTGEFTDIVRCGRGRFVGDAREYVLVEDSSVPDGMYDARVGRNEIVLHALRNCGVDLRLDPSLQAEFAKHDLVHVEWTCLATGRVKRALWRANWTRHPKDDAVSHRFPPGSIVLPEPGRYRLRFVEVPSIASFEVEVPARECVTYVVGQR